MHGHSHFSIVVGYRNSVTIIIFITIIIFGLYVLVLPVLDTYLSLSSFITGV